MKKENKKSHSPGNCGQAIHYCDNRSQDYVITSIALCQGGYIYD